MKKEVHAKFFLFLVAVFLLFSFSLLFLFTPSLTGMVTSTGSTTVTQAGGAGISITDSAIAFGSGYYNATCVGNTFATLDSNLTYSDGSGTSVYGPASPYCWVNTTAIMGGLFNDKHSLQNNGTALVNVSVIANLHGEDWLCGGNCPFTNIAGLQVLSYGNEPNSCPVSGTLTSGYEKAMDFNANLTVGICDQLDFRDSSDTVDVFVNVSVPKDATSGAKSVTLTYEALAY